MAPTKQAFAPNPAIAEAAFKAPPPVIILEVVALFFVPLVGNVDSSKTMSTAISPAQMILFMVFCFQVNVRIFVLCVTCYVDNQCVTSIINPDSSAKTPDERLETDIAHFGISTALLTPFHADGSLNLPLLCEHANETLENGVNGVTLFGTTGEGASIGFSERAAAISALLDSGVSAQQMTLGLCASAISDVLVQVQQGVEFGICQLLLLPPFYFKGSQDTGLFEWHKELFDKADKRAKFILYHIPQVTQVPLSVELVLQLRNAFPERVMAIKDSAGNWDNTRALLESGEIPVLVGDERLLHKAAAMGGAGSICGLANLYPRRMRTLFDSHVEDVALSADVDLIVSVPVIPALKLIMMRRSGNESWGRLRAPLQALQGDDRKAIELGFASDSTA